jgi:DNA-binding NtrC family response regulator
MQVKLLRFLEMRELERVGGTRSIQVDVRLLAASNADLEGLVKENRLREDLYYRLNVVRIKLPPLRDRKEDIPLLVHSFINEFSRINRKDVTGISPQALEAFQLYDWPGNVRELRNCIESMVVLSKSQILEKADIPPPIGITTTPIPVLPVPGSLNIKVIEKELIRNALEQSSGNKKQAAELLGLSRRTLYRKLEEYGLK